MSHASTCPAADSPSTAHSGPGSSAANQVRILVVLVERNRDPGEVGVCVCEVCVGGSVGKEGFYHPGGQYKPIPAGGKEIIWNDVMTDRLKRYHN